VSVSAVTHQRRRWLLAAGVMLTFVIVGCGGGRRSAPRPGHGAVAIDGSRTNLPDTYVPPGWNQWDVAGFGYPEFDYRLNENGRLQSYGHRPADYLTDVLAAKGVAFINSAAAAHQPFFLELATFAPHSPYVRGDSRLRDRPASTSSPAARPSGSGTVHG
jgi:hypothetical protein